MENWKDFATLVTEHQSMVFSVALHFLRDRMAAEELAQDVFLQLHDALPGLETPDHVRFWLRRVTGHRCIDYIRRHKHDPLPLEDVAEPSSPPQDFGDPMLRRRLQQVVASLPEKQRIVVILRFQEEMDVEEIARVLAMPLATVKSRLHRSLAVLREKLERVTGMSCV